MLLALKKKELHRDKLHSLLFAFLATLFLSIPVSSSEEIVDTEAVIPAGTRMVLPHTILEKYQAEAHLWGWPLNYLSYHYSYVGSSLEEGKEKESTYYFPLSREDDRTVGGHDIIMIDFMNLQTIDKEQGIFITLYDIQMNDALVLHKHFMGSNN